MLGQVLRGLMRGRPAGTGAAIPAAGAAAGLAPGAATRVADSAESVTLPAALAAQGAQSMLKALAARVAAGLQQELDDNFDAERWGEARGQRAMDTARAVSEQCLATLLQWPAEFEAASRHLDDEASRRLLIDLLAFRLLGHRHVRLPLDTARHWQQRERAAAMAVGASPVSGPFGAMQRFRVDFAGAPVSLDAYAGNIAWTFLLGQYYLARGDAIVAPQPGDVVIDAGACFGDTALAFAASVGGAGRVHAFEVDAGNLQVARHNLAANPALSARVELNEQALGRQAGTLYLHGSGPGARVSTTPGGRPVPVTDIDGFVAQAALPRVDFIKMDIEGAEFDALQGAAGTIGRWRPRLAVSVYHHVADLARIANWIAGLGLGYRLFLEHYTIHHEESVLYALPAKAGLQ